MHFLSLLHYQDAFIKEFLVHGIKVEELRINLIVNNFVLHLKIVRFPDSILDVYPQILIL